MKCVYRLEGAEWISQKGVWRMPMMHYSALLKALPAVPGVRLDVQPLPTIAQALVKVWQSLHRHQSAALTQIYAMVQPEGMHESNFFGCFQKLQVPCSL